MHICYPGCIWYIAHMLTGLYAMHKVYATGTCVLYTANAYACHALYAVRQYMPHIYMPTGVTTVNVPFECVGQRDLFIVSRSTS